MTQTDIMNALHENNLIVHDAVVKVSERMPSVKAKFYDGKLPCNTHFTLEECEEIYKEIGANPLQLIYLKENFREEYSDIYEITGTHKFLEEYKKNPDIKCCNTCKYCIGKTSPNHIIPHPYCEVYDKYLSSFDAKVYEDWCSSYLRIKLPNPRQWFKDNAPVNLNMYGKTDTVNGIEKEKMYAAKKRSVPNTIVRVNQVGFDE